MLRIDFVGVSLVIGVTILLVDIFFEEYMFGYNTPIMLIALALVVFALIKQRIDEKKGK